MESFAPTADLADTGTDDFPAFCIAPALPLYDERRPAMRTRPFKAWHHFRELLKNKESTEEVFRIFEALPWRGARARAEGWLKTPLAQQLRVSEPSIAAILDDHAALRKLPAGSVGQLYCDFMECEGLSAQGLIDEFERFLGDGPRFNDQFLWYYDRIRDTHDLLHILTGLGRDALGEASVLAYTYSQQPSPANLFISYAAGLNMKKQVGNSAPILGSIREMQVMGRGCEPLAERSIRELLAMPLEEARASIGITPPTTYHRAHELWKAQGIDPYDLLGKKAA